MWGPPVVIQTSGWGSPSVDVKKRERRRRALVLVLRCDDDENIFAEFSSAYEKVIRSNNRVEKVTKDERRLESWRLDSRVLGAVG